jgi:hypothetical protein
MSRLPCWGIPCAHRVAREAAQLVLSPPVISLPLADHPSGYDGGRHWALPCPFSGASTFPCCAFSAGDPHHPWAAEHHSDPWRMLRPNLGLSLLGLWLCRIIWATNQTAMPSHDPLSTTGTYRLTPQAASRQRNTWPKDKSNRLSHLFPAHPSLPPQKDNLSSSSTPPTTPSPQFVS